KVHLGKVRKYLSISGRVPLMLFHHIREHVAVARFGKSLYRFYGRKRLEAELRHIAELMVAVVGKRKASVPYLPVMNVAPVWIVWLIEASSRRRACRPVESIGVFLLQYLREDILVHLYIVGFLPVARYPFAHSDEHLHLVVA